MVNSPGSASWETLAADKRARQAALIPEHLKLKSLPGPDVLDVTTYSFKNVLSPRDIEITESADVGLLLAKIASGEWTSLEVAQAYCNRALVAHQLVNCLTEIFVDRAIERAKELDAHYARTGTVIGPLHGLPISLKDQIAVKGVELSMGYVGWLGNISEEDSVLADILQKQGAILYCRTNVPQTLMFGESRNNVFGITSNPFNRNLTCGGSSGGEGALVGMKGSVLGVGSDVGGSVRIPSAFQGLYGLRPSYNRVPYQGSANSLEGQESISSVLGPISSSVDGLKIFMKAVVDAKPWRYDPLALRQPWSDEEYHLASHGGEGAKLSFAMMWDDNVVKPHPPYARAMEETKQALLAAGHEVIDWSPLNPVDGCQFLGDIFNADGGHDLALSCALSGEPLLSWDTIAAAEPKHLSTFEYWQLCKAKRAFIKTQLDHWEASASRTSTGRPVDAIICPVMAHVPLPHFTSGYIYYSGFANLCDWPASTFPVTRVDPVLDPIQAPHAFFSVDDEKMYKLYDPKIQINAPIGLQCVGRKGEEEAVIRMTEIIDAALKVSRV